MKYLDPAALDAVDGEAFRARDPYPWANPAGLLTEEGYAELHRNLPDLSLFEPHFGQRRKYGQRPHDRYVLEWEPGLAIPAPWAEFVEELRGPVYRAFLERVLGRRDFWLRFHWHYAPRGASVSPHCDSKHKLGSHLFYFNRSDEWDPTWGGETLILDDGGRFHSDSNPDFGDFDSARGGVCIDNHSLIFLRRGDSWHGVREITCPEGRMRRVFIVVFEKPRLRDRLKRLLGARS